MGKSLLIRGAKQLVTLRGPVGPRRGADLRNLAIIPDGSVLIVDGIVRQVGLSRRLDNLAEARHAEEINANGRVVLPGFVDSHTHLVSGPARLADYELQLAGASQAEIALAGGGPMAIIRLLREVPIKTLISQGRRIVQQMMRQGTTTIEAKSGYGVNESGEIKFLRAHAALNREWRSIGSTLLAAHIEPEKSPDEITSYVEWLAGTLLPLVRRRKLAQFVDMACEEGQFTKDQTRYVLERAKALGFSIKLHAGQYCDIGGARLAVQLGASTVDHAIYLNYDDLVALAHSDTIVILLPGPVFYLGLQKFADARSLIDRGAAVALATDFNPETCPSHSLQMIIALACRKMEMTPAEAISAATINGAHAMGLSAKIGSIEVGKQADLIMLSVPDYREIPYHFGVNLVEMTMKCGQVVYQSSEVKCPTD